MSYRQTRPLVPFYRPKASQLSDFGRPRASLCNDTPYESEITTAPLKLKSLQNGSIHTELATLAPHPELAVSLE
jgi:hypothetical protein